MKLVILIGSAALAVLSIALLKVYKHVPPRELKRRARKGDQLAAALFRAAAYETSLDTMLWTIAGLANAWFFLLAARSLPFGAALLVCALLLWIGFVWLPARRASPMSTWLAAHLAGPLAWLLMYLHPLIDRATQLMVKHWPITVHTGLYDKDDLLELLRYQTAQSDNRIGQLELNIATHALNFGDRMIRDVMVPRRAVKMVSADDTIGPILMSELHDSGFSRFPVYTEKKDNVVGVLFLRDLVRAKTGGKISHAMQPDPLFVHEEQPLSDALQAVLKTHRHLFIVVNSFEEYVGIVTLEDVLEQIIGQPIVDEFDQYDDVRAVAERAARKEHENHVEPEKPSTPATEVVE